MKLKKYNIPFRYASYETRTPMNYFDQNYNNMFKLSKIRTFEQVSQDADVLSTKY